MTTQTTPKTYTVEVKIESKYGDYTVPVLCVEGCERCPDAYVPHYNCLYSGHAMGHSAAHCTANACY